MLTREQRYAGRIFDQVNAILSGQPRSFQKKYGAMAHKLPILIRTAGLAQALAFVDARGDDAAHQLLNDLAAILGYQSGFDLVENSLRQEFRAYLHLTQQAMAALLWYKRFAQSVLDVEAGDEGDTVDKKETEQTNVTAR